MADKTGFRVEDGVTLRGLFYRAETRDGGPAPAVVMINGFSGVKESLVPYAELFNEAGLNVLLYDNRNFGESEGEPRQHINPYRQLDDLRYAISFLQSLDGVDPRRIGMMGTSLSGGHALVAAATDRRIKCVVSQSPFVSGMETARRFFPVDKMRSLQKMFDKERDRRRLGEVPTMVPVLSAADELMCLPPRVSERFMERSSADTPQWKNEVTLQSLEHFLQYEPIAYAPYVAPTPLLVVVGNRDIVCFSDLAMQAYERALEPKNIVVLPTGHWAIYYPPVFEHSGGAARDWFVAHLMNDGQPVAR